MWGVPVDFPCREGRVGYPKRRGGGKTSIRVRKEIPGRNPVGVRVVRRARLEKPKKREEKNETIPQPCASIAKMSAKKCAIRAFPQPAEGRNIKPDEQGLAFP